MFALLTTVGLLAGAQSRQSVGLVLSGGGAKGIAHIGVIKALEEHDIPIDYIAGTSMGSIVGGLYAAGYTPEEMMELIESKGFAYWSTGKIDKDLTYYFSENEPTPALGSVSVGPKDSTEVKSILPGSLISPLPMNFAFMDLFAGYTAQCGGDFDKLFVPFRCVTSDVYHKHKIVLRGGDFGDAIRASMSFPMVFHPIELDSLLVYDGGIYDNFPVDVMREDFAPAIMIGVDVSAPDKKPDPNDLFQQLEDMIIQNNDYSLPADEGIKIKVDVSQFGLLDFGKAREIYRYGYDKAMEMIDSIEKRVTSRTPAAERNLRRDVFKSRTPYVRFDSVTVTGGTPRQNDYVAYLFDHRRSRTDTFGIADARDAYYRAITPGRLRNLVPHAVYNSANGLFRLDLKSIVKDNFKLGVGGYVSSSTSSMLFMSAGYNTLSFNSFETNINGWIGQSYLAGVLNARINLRTPNPSRIGIQFVASRQKFYESDQLFFEDNQPVFITDREMSVRIGLETAAGRRGIAGAGVGYGHLNDKFYQTGRISYAGDQRDRAVQKLWQIYARYRHNTLDNAIYPTAGAYYSATAIGVTGNYELTDGETGALSRYDRRWIQGEVITRNYFRAGQSFSFGVETDLLWSTRKLLPYYDASLVDAPAFNPTPSTYNTFNTALRANQFIAAGAVPVVRISDMVQVRGTAYGFLPVRAIQADPVTGGARYGKWFSDPQFFGEMAAVVTLPFANLCAYGNYMSGPSRGWTFGISFGVFVLAPKYLR